MFATTLLWVFFFRVREKRRRFVHFAKRFGITVALAQLGNVWRRIYADNTLTQIRLYVFVNKNSYINIYVTKVKKMLGKYEKNLRNLRL